jgi:hypothetical protein
VCVCRVSHSARRVEKEKKKRGVTVAHGIMSTYQKELGGGRHKVELKVPLR